MIFKRLPIVPLAPILIDNKSPVAVIEDPGLQSKDKSPPVDSPVEVEDKDKTLPVVRELAVTVEAVVVVPVKVWVDIPVPDAIVKFLPAAIVVSPFNDMAPVPVPKVPVPEIAKLPEA